MPRIRSIKPDYWKSEKLAARLPGPEGREARRLFIGLWNFAEDHGVIRGAPAYIRSELYPYDDDVTTADVARWLGLLESGGFVVRYQRDGSSYLWIRGFKDHQRIEKPSKPTLPAPSETERRLPREGSGRAPGGLPEPSRKSAHGGGGGGEVEVETEVDEEPPPTPSAEDAPAAEYVTVPMQGRDITGLPVVRQTTSVRWDPTADGCWEMMQLYRELRSLPQERDRPDDFEDWFARAFAQAGPAGIVSTYLGFLGDPTIRARNWPTAAFIKGIWDARSRELPLELPT